ncbi:hypothetical protein GCM10023086_76410 [Streptomyces venetus]|uniref:Uncharacterized protein n=1 Tax=Streptomyces venetus TaxID=1701086 RepID=A0ABP8HKT5_9ACTN
MASRPTSEANAFSSTLPLPGMGVSGKALRPVNKTNLQGLRVAFSGELHLAHRVRCRCGRRAGGGAQAVVSGWAGLR